ncbi:hypothetical protein EZS27_026642 [termite gut metagenome]|uniref:Tyrosine recombinase XerC n=1 Tax=termite gut metagenome TaxID=433724 RepID=A0A5J4QR16_9ZZZZ
MNIKRNIIFSLESRKKNGKPIVINVPIRMRVMYAGQRIEFTTGYRIDAAKWDEAAQRAKNGCTNKLKQNASQINNDLSKYYADIQTIFKEFEIAETIPIPRQVKTAFTEKQKGKSIATLKHPFFERFDDFVKERGAKNDWTFSTYEKFASVKNHLLAFDKDIQFNDWNEFRLTDYVNYLRAEKKMRNSTIDNQLDFLRWFLRWAVERGYSENRAFDAFKPKLKTTRKKVIFLTWEELNRLRDYTPYLKARNTLSGCGMCSCSVASQV